MVLCGSHVLGETQGRKQDSGPDRAFTPLSEMIPDCPTPAPLELHQSLQDRHRHRAHTQAHANSSKYTLTHTNSATYNWFQLLQDNRSPWNGLGLITSHRANNSIWHSWTYNYIRSSLQMLVEVEFFFYVGLRGRTWTNDTICAQ